MGMLAKARAIAAKNNVGSDRLTFVQGAFQTLMNHVQGPFDAIVTKGNSLPHLLEDSEIELAIAAFHELLRPGGTLIIGMRDFGPFMQDRPRFIPGLIHDDEGNEFITFDLWEWLDGPPVLATQNLYIVSGHDPDYTTLRRRVVYRPLSTDEVKVVLLEAGFEDITDTPDRAERVLVAKRSESMKRSPLWAKHAGR
jgi:SAM-dependent methyltransferase